MQKGFYWVQRDDYAPEVWYFADGEGGGWYQPSQSLPLQPLDFEQKGYSVISDKLEPPHP
ncbi:hypothetical protein QU24_26360 [Pantoea rodasii]|uniref:Uncharacterized protein n=1 Tax=Pantoea rodasii TaxID=1076549 RepID=A0A0B1QXJ3_9GAMM|nr:hypothetical protein QU24_26360 [Pantoea rodasii]